MERANILNKVPKKITIPFCVFFVVYFGISLYFMNHFYFASKINGISVSGKTVKETKTEMASEIKTYTLSLKERNGQSEQIKASDIDLSYNSDQQFENLKAEQNPLSWIVSVFSTKNSKMTVKVTYDKEKLKKLVDKLSCINSSKIIEPKNASFKYDNNSYVIVNEVKGDEVNKEALYKSVVDAISGMETTIDLDAANCYVNPQYTSTSPKVTQTKDTLNKYVASKITYTFGDSKKTLDGSTINKWLTVDKNLNVSLDEKKVKYYVDVLAYTYNTIDKTRSFHTTSGKTINISGGDYGWQIGINKETQALITNIKSGQTVTKEPIYAQKASSHSSSDIGNTYVEVDMTKQHLWFYKNGSLVVQGDVVTGNISLNDTTPVGVYSLKYKERNASLKGQDYNTKVSYWMPFNNNIGLHDATWRSKFGGQIYKTSGSHGCVNCPYDLAQTIYQNIDPGTPIVCYY